MKQSIPTYKEVKNLLSDGKTNAKTSKNAIKTYILYLAPSNLSGANVCPYASPGCILGCLNTSGMGVFSNVQLARINKTLIFKENRPKFYIQLAEELLKIHDKAIKQNIDIAIRLNGTSDIDHLNELIRHTGIDFLDTFYSNLKFYDYTKNPKIVSKYLNTNYKITFSRSEINDSQVDEVLKNGGNVAVVFKNELPATYKGYKVINGDESDLRYYDPKNVIVGLKAKGKAKKDISGFVINNI
jgi:ribosomal protein S18